MGSDFSANKKASKGQDPGAKATKGQDPGASGSVDKAATSQRSSQKGAASNGKKNFSLYKERNTKVKGSTKKYKEHGIFGVPLQTLLEHDQKLAPDIRVPIVCLEILHYLSKNCLDTEGILRIPGSSTRIKTLRQEMEEKFYQGTFRWGPDLTPYDVATLMKQFLRDLPVPLLTDEYIDAFAQVEELPDKKQQLHALNLLVLLLPSVHRDTLGALLDLLLEIISHSDTNKMSLNNVAMIMAPILFLAPKIGNANIGKNKDALDLEIKMAQGYNIVRMIIQYKHILWTQNAMKAVSTTNIAMAGNLENNADIFESRKTPEDVQQLDPKAITLFYKALKDGKEKVNNIRLMVVGMYGVGKTSLINNLIWEFRNKTHAKQPLSTEGIDIHRCKLMTDGDWCLDKDLKGVKYEGRIQKLVCNNQMSTDTHSETEYNDETANSHVTLYERITSTKDHETQTQSEPLQTFKERLALEKDDEILQHGIKFAKKMLETNSDNSEKGKALLDESKSEITVSVWDFAGQTLYYSTHQFFLNKRSIYVVVMDMTKSLEDVVSKSDGIGIWCGLVDECTYLDIFKFWLNSIHMNSDYQAGKRTIKPTIILVGTRKDKMKGSAEEIEKNMNLYFDDALCSFDENSPVFEHIYSNRFLVNNLSPNDPAFGELQKEIISLAAKQDYWDEEYPVRWIHMEQTLDKMRAQKLQIVKMKDVEEENLKKVHPLGREELTLFLELQHKQGNIIFFNSGKLKDFVVLAPQWIIEAFKCFIPHNQKIKATVLKDWEEYKKHAILKPNVLSEVMKNSPPYIHEYEDAVIRYMEYLNVIAQPLPNADAINGIPNQHERVRDETSGLYDYNPKMLNCHIVPCLLSRAPPPIDSFTSPDKPRTPVLAFVFCGKFMPPSFFHRLVAVCIRAWPISQERDQYCLFNGLAIFDLNSIYTLRIWYMDYIIYARIVCCSENAKLDNFVWRIQEVRHTLKNSLQDFVHQSSPAFEENIQCPNMKVSLHNKGLFRVKQFDYETEMSCPVCSIPHTVKRSDAMKHWFNEMLDQNETDMEIN
ncbi:uncharacterized protein LOC127857188 [Dreissena polymorpha]|nr:uncharacterized protein LOC127857188 [Dreissena polymorpha]